jgi:thiamine-phosphate pyrophosphorylase
MVKTPSSQSTRPAPRLYLVIPPVDDADALAGLLRTAIEAADVAAVLLHLKPAAERELIDRTKTLAAIVQPTGAALVLAGHAEIVARAGADGAHLTGIAAFTDAVETLKPERIAGCGGLTTRHDAMTAGERGADYVMFGEPKPDGYRPPLEATLDRVEWWSALFEIPCVAYAGEPGEITSLVAAGADFIAVGGSLWDDPRGVAAALGDIVRQFAVPEPAA